MARLFSIGPGIQLKGRKFKGLRGFAGKPFHPPLTDLVVGAYFFVGCFDLISLISDDPRTEYEFFRAGTIVLISGFLFSLPTMLTGFWDWLKSTPPHTQVWRTANFHMATMLTVAALVIADILIRTSGEGRIEAGPRLTTLSLAITGLMTLGATYGGSLTYDYSFNVEELDGRVWEPSEVDIYPADKPMK
ncbi:MAG TPA: DUF2231 domain-containing protein [Actinomycetota bacterium]|nr:DUF2231 domain-containing protein [Actinomycetota bacterium]